MMGLTETMEIMSEMAKNEKRAELRDKKQALLVEECALEGHEWRLPSGVSLVGPYELNKRTVLCTRCGQNGVVVITVHLAALSDFGRTATVLIKKEEGV